MLMNVDANVVMRQAAALRQEEVHMTLAQRAVVPDTAQSRVREYAKLEVLLQTVGVATVQEEAFLALCAALAPYYSPSRLESLRSALVWKQLEALPFAQCWTQHKRFRRRFRGALKMCRPFTERGALSEDKLLALVRWLCSGSHEMYARGMVVGFYALLRHSDLVRVRPGDIEFGVREVLVSVLGGKGRERHHVDVVRATEARQSLTVAVAAAQAARSLTLFPDWDKGKANALIREFALLSGWDPEQKWTFHSLRHGFAQHLKREGVNEAERMHRGRWTSRRVADWYAREG